MFYLDLDEMESLAKKFLFLSNNRFNFFSFRDKDHLQLPKENPDKTKNTKQHILDYLKLNDVELNNPKIMLLTNLSTLGYQFNPVSFYFVSSANTFSDSSSPFPSEHGSQYEAKYCIVEISNTFREMKPFFLGKNNFDGKKFSLNTAKYFYVSPFTDMDANLDFNIELPEAKMHIKIDCLSPAISNRKEESNSRKILITMLTGRRKAITNMRLFWYAIRFPFITLQIISLIHWNAFCLWLKKIPYHKKNSNIDLQRGVYRPCK